MKKTKILNSVNQTQTSNIAYNFTQVNGTVTELEIYDEIASKRSKNWSGEETGTQVTPKNFKEELNSVKTPEIVVRMNSGGGEVSSANVIAVAIQEARAKGKKISCKIDGVCASAAVQIALACSPVKIHSSAYMMIHDPMLFMLGYYNSSEMNGHIKQLDAIKKGIINSYTAKTGMNEDEIAKMMSETTWMDGKEAVEKGFADELMFEEENENDVLNRISHAVFNLTMVPQSIKDKLEMAKGEKIMNREELEATYPEIINEIRQEAIKSVDLNPTQEAIDKAVTEAVNNERARMKAIDEMTGKVNQEVLDKAKYETFDKAETVAFNALKNGDFVNTAVINGMIDETGDNNGISGFANGGVSGNGKDDKALNSAKVSEIAKKHLEKTGKAVK